jgi:hypothetical protein
MADKEELKGGISFDTTNAVTGITEMNRAIRILDTEFKAASSGIQDWTNDVSGNEAKIKSLNGIIDLQKQKVSALTTEYEKAKTESGANSRATENLAIQVNKAQGALNKNQLELKKTSENLKKLETEQKKQPSLWSQFSASAKKSSTSVNSASESMKQHFSGLKASVLGFAAGLISINTIKGIGKLAEEAEAPLSQLNSVLKSTGGAAGVTKDAVLNLSESLSKQTKFAADDVTIAQNMLLTFTNIGKNVFPNATETALNMSQALGQDLKSSSIQLGKALNNPLTGMTALQRVGVTFTASQKEQIKAMTDANDVAGAQGVILKELQKEFGGSAKAAGKDFSGQITIAKNSIHDAGEAAAVSLVPIAASIMPSITRAAKDLASAVTQHKAEIQNAVQTILNAVKGVFGFVSDNGPIIKNVLLGIAGAVVVWKTAVLAANVVQEVNNALTVANAVATGGLAAGKAALTAATGGTTAAMIVQNGAVVAGTVATLAHNAAMLASKVAMGAATAAQWLLNAALNANPIGIVITAVAALTAGIIALYNNNKKFRDFVNGLWEWIKSSVVNTINSIKNVNWGELGQNIMKGIVNGFGQISGWIWGKIQDAGNSIVNGFKSFFGIHSPSTKMRDEVGVYVGEGISEGVSQTAPQAYQSGIAVGNAIGSGVTAGVNNSTDYSSFISGVNNLESNIEDALKKRYESEEKAQENHLNKRLDKLSKWKDESEKEINDYYDNAESRAERAATAQEAAIQKQINAIDAEATAEDRAAKLKEYTDKITDLQKQIAFSHDDYNKSQLQKQLDSTTADYQKQVSDYAREDKKTALQNQITVIKDTLDAQKKAMDAEKKQELADIDEIYSKKKTRLENQLAAVKDYYAKAEESANLEAEAEKMIMQNNQNDIVALLQSYSGQYKAAGTTLGDMLVQGFQPAINNIKSMISSITASIQNAKEAALEAKAEAASSRMRNESNNDNRSYSTKVYVGSTKSSASEISRQNENVMRRMARGLS